LAHLALRKFLCYFFTQIRTDSLISPKNKQCSAAAKLLGLDKVAATDSPMMAFIASLQGSSIKVVQQCDVDNSDDKDYKL
jgi:hypothetical protein